MYGALAFLWPALVAAEAGQWASAMAEQLSELSFAGEATARPPRWTTPSRVRLELPALRLRDFSVTGDNQPPTLICAPLSLHGATVADFAKGHSLVETLLGAGLGQLLVSEWRSATPEMRFLSIDSLLADLNVAVDELRWGCGWDG